MEWQAAGGWIEAVPEVYRYKYTCSGCTDVPPPTRPMSCPQLVRSPVAGCMAVLQPQSAAD